jgi:hypothetical protein
MIILSKGSNKEKISFLFSSSTEITQYLVKINDGKKTNEWYCTYDRIRDS